MINFKCVRWKNFLSTGNQFTEIQLDKEPTTLIIGENGAGKSTILDALCFSLFGKPFRNISKMQMVNSINNSSTIVEVEFKIGTVEYKVVRSIKPNKFEIYQNNILMNQEANARDYQKILEQQILKLNYRSFTQVVILGSSTFVPFMQLKARHRREVVEEILDIQIFSTMNLILKQRLKIILDDIRENDYQYELASEKISFQENHIADLKDNKEKIIQQKQRLIETNEKEISRRTDERNQLENDNANSLTSIDDKISVETKSTRLKDIQSTLVEKHKTHTSMVGFFENNEDCPTCQQHIDEAFKTDMISQKRTEADKVQSGMKELKSELDKISLRKKEIKEITDSIRNNQVSIAKIDSSVLELKKFNVQLETEISQFKLDGSASSDVDKLKELKNEAELCSRQKSKLREDKLYAEAARNMLQDTGIKTKIIKQYLPIMNKLINKYLTSMEFYVNFTLDENFEETIKSRYRDEFSYASFSEGEKMRIDLALLFTWRAVAKMKNSTNTNLLILDEIFDSSLDGTGTDEFLKILNTLSGENVFVISHKQDALADKFRSTIKFEKVKNFSHVAT
jgi:DNA repair exonuclease SbcCD ATPase subunit